jgi:hypothetical protein
MDIDGKKVEFSHMPKGMKTPKLSNCRRIASRSSQMMIAVPENPSPKGNGFSGWFIINVSFNKSSP